MGKFEGNRPLGRSRLRWEDHIKMDFREADCDAGGWIDLAEDWEQRRNYVIAITNLRVP